MKTALDLPDDLVKEVKLRAIHENRKLKDAVADLLRKGLAHTGADAKSEFKSPFKIERESGLPLIECRKAAVREISAKRAAEILLDQEIKWHEEAG